MSSIFKKTMLITAVIACQVLTAGALLTSSIFSALPMNVQYWTGFIGLSIIMGTGTITGGNILKKQ